MCKQGQKEDSATNSAREEGVARTPFRWLGGQDSRPRLSVERARQLVRTALPSGEDKAARALIQLLVGIAYEPDALQRDALAVYASEESFTLTQEFSRALDKFATEGEAEKRE
jgi:hypothetical protein